MSDDLQQLISETRQLIATSRRLKAEYDARAKEYLSSNTELCAGSQGALEQSIKALAKPVAS